MYIRPIGLPNMENTTPDIEQMINVTEPINI